MINKRFIFWLYFTGILAACSEKPYLQIKTNGSDPFIEELISKMTLDEKLGQMTLFTTDWESTGPTIRGGYEDDIRKGKCGALFNSHTVEFTTRLQKIAVEESRLKIPLLFGYDVVHGYKTIFPIPLGAAASWDLDAIEKSAYIMSKEAASAGLHWTFSPMVDISRDPRWGRVMEGTGEDTYLGSKIAGAMVKGIQGDGFEKADRLIACVKHFAAYGAPAGGRDYNTVDMSERVLREVYLPPYKAAVDAGALTVMTSFNEYDGVPASGNKFLLTDILRKEWGFNGFVVTDYTSINEMVEHGVVSDETEAGILSIQAGVDMDMQSGAFQEKVKKGLETGQLTSQQIDNSVRNILKIKKKLGLFVDPFRFSDPEREKLNILNEENLNFAREISKKSIVLLKNNGVLPVSNNIKKILLTGPLAADKENLTGVWSASGEGRHCVSLLEGMQNNPRSKTIRIEHLKGCDFESDDRSGFNAVLKAAEDADIIILAIGENKEMSGEAASRAMIRIPGVQEELLKALKASGKPIITVVMNGRPLVLKDVHDHSDALIEAWWLGTQAGNALADVIYGDYNPSGKLPMTFPIHEGQIPVFYSHKNTGRPFNPDSKWTTKYLDIPNEPLYPFGYGLSYTTFNYGPVKTDKKSFRTNETVSVSVELHNSGTIDGEEVVQLYVRDLVASVTRPVKELKGFRKVMLKAGEKKIIQFTLKEKDLTFLDRNMNWVTEPGDFEVFVGTDSDTQNKAKITFIH